ncbi:hypothetical protein HYU92_03700 [Candidatus Curtissbacteria bacterium]|nr:hypothetical protein [Candidatus Curtissbacteria bacterium]
MQVKSDDVLVVTQRTRSLYGEFDPLSETTVELTKHEINSHSVEGKRSFGRKIIYRWVPSIIHVEPEQEQAIQALIEKGVYDQDLAQQVRDQIIFENQRRLRG